MSSESLSIVRYQIFQGFCQAGVPALIFYENTLTLNEEIELMWHGTGGTAARVLYFLNRLNMTALGIIGILSLPEYLVISCKTVNVMSVVFDLISISISSIITALRVHIFGSRNWYLTSFVLGLGLVPIGLNLAICTEEIYKVVPILPLWICQVNDRLSYGTVNRGVVAARTCAIASDLTVVLVTVYHAFRSQSISVPDLYDKRPTLSAILLRDGVFYFVTLTLLNVADIILYFADDTLVNLSVFIFPISSILVSRFLLHICGSGRFTDLSREVSTLDFAAPRHDSLSEWSHSSNRTSPSSRTVSAPDQAPFELSTDVGAAFSSVVIADP